MNTPSAELTVFRASGFACIRIVGRANFASAPGFQDAMRALIGERPARLVLDLVQCQLMDSTFLGVLADAAVKFRQSGAASASIELSNANERINGLVDGLGLKSLFTATHDALQLPVEVHASRVAFEGATKLQLKQTSLAAHEQLIQLNEENRAKFAELTRVLKEDLASLEAGQPPALPGFDIAAVNQQAGEVGGDFYDFAPRSGLRAGVLLADTCGKGAEAAQIAVRCRPVLRGLLCTERSPAAVLAGALPRIVPDLPPGKFVTALCLVLDSVTRSFQAARAGHEPLLWLHAATQVVERLAPKGMALGIEHEGLLEATFVEREHHMEPGDVLLLHSDGITENFNPAGEEFGCDRLVETLKAGAALDAKAIGEKILTAVDEFKQGAPRLDDRTLIVIKAV